MCRRHFSNLVSSSLSPFFWISARAKPASHSSIDSMDSEQRFFYVENFASNRIHVTREQPVALTACGVTSLGRLRDTNLRVPEQAHPRYHTLGTAIVVEWLD